MRTCVLWRVLVAVTVVITPVAVSAQFNLRTIYDYPAGRNPKRVVRTDNANKIMVDSATDRILINSDLLTSIERDKKEELETCVGKDGKVIELKRWFPTRENPKHAKCLFFEGGPEVLKSADFLGSAHGITATTELFGDVFYGVRLGFSTAVTAPAETHGNEEGDGTVAEQTAAEQNLDLLAANGGNLALTTNYPIYFRGFPHPVEADRKTGYVLTNFVGRAAGTVGEFEPVTGGGTATTYNLGDVSASTEAGVEGRVAASSEENVFGLLAYSKISLVAGTEAFSKAIGSKANNPFLHVRAAVGARLGGAFTLGVGWAWYSDDDIPGGGVTLILGLSR